MSILVVDDNEINRQITICRIKKERKGGYKWQKQVLYQPKPKLRL